MQTWNDRDILNDMLDAQKTVTGLYNINVNECADEHLRAAMMRILDEEHGVQAQVFDELQKRGWYPTEQAPPDKIRAAKQQFCAG